MAAEDPKTYLWATLCRLTKLGPEDPARVGVDEMHRAVRKVVGRGTVQRIKEGETSVGVDALCKLAGVFSLEVWQLLAPAVHARPGQPYSARALRVAAIYDQVSPKDRRHIDAVADAAASIDAPPDTLTLEDDSPPAAPTSKPTLPTRIRGG